MIPQLNMSQLEKKKRRADASSSAHRCDPNAAIFDSSRPSNGGTATAAVRPTSSAAATTAATRPNGSTALTDRRGASHPSGAKSAVPPSSLVSAPAPAVSWARRAAEVQHLLDLDVLDCQDVTILQHRLIELAEKVLQLSQYYDDQQQTQWVWYQQRLSAMAACLPAPAHSTASGNEVASPGRKALPGRPLGSSTSPSGRLPGTAVSVGSVESMPSTCRSGFNAASTSAVASPKGGPASGSTTTPRRVLRGQSTGGGGSSSGRKVTPSPLGKEDEDRRRRKGAHTKRS